MDRYIATHDRLTNLANRLSDMDIEQSLKDTDGDGMRGGVDSVACLRSTFEQVWTMCDRVYGPLIERHEKMTQLNATLNLLNRHQEALSLPSQVLPHAYLL
jgi:hypothetical protein